MGTDRLVVGGAVLAVLLVAGSGVAVRGAADRVRTEEERPPARIEVSCSPAGITVSAREVAAGAAGVTVDVSSTMADGAYLVLAASAAAGETRCRRSPRRGCGRSLRVTSS